MQKNNNCKVVSPRCFVKCPKTGERILAKFCYDYCKDSCEFILRVEENREVNK